MKNPGLPVFQAIFSLKCGIAAWHKDPHKNKMPGILF
jgi:hypothetical protein